MAAALSSEAPEVHPVFRCIGDSNGGRAPRNGPLGPNDFLIDKNKFTIGRGTQNSKVLADLRVSRSHCKLEKDGDAWYITNMSVNAVMVNGYKLPKNQRALLRFSDVVQIVPNEFVYEFQSGTEVANAGDNIDKDEIIKIAESFIRENQNEDLLGFTQSAVLLIAGINTSVMVVDEPPRTPAPLTTLELFNAKKPTVIDLSSPSISKVDTSKPGTSTDAATSGENNFAEELSCTICMELFYKAVTLNCCHSFCEYCIREWKKNNKLCPICRVKLIHEVPSIILNNLVDKLVDTLPLEDRRRREEIIKERQPKPPTKKKTKAKAKGRTTARGSSRRMPTRRTMANPVAIIDLDNYSDSTLSSSDTDFDMMEYIDDFFNYDPSTDYPYYGGYGNCYICHMPGHWANGCPNRS